MSLKKINKDNRIGSYSLDDRQPVFASDVNPIIDAINELKPYKLYVALINQSGSGIPVATVIENTLGGDLVWSGSSGSYYATLSGAFTDINKVFIPAAPSSRLSQKDSVEVYWNNADSIGLSTVTFSTYGGAGSVEEGILDGYNFPLEIRVYN